MKLGLINRSSIIFDQKKNVYKSSNNFVEYVKDLSNYFEVSILAPTTNYKCENTNSLLPEDISVYSLFVTKKRGRIFKYFLYIMSIFKLIYYMKEYDYILLMMPSPQGFQGFLASRLLRKKTVSYLGSSWREVLRINYSNNLFGNILVIVSDILEKYVMRNSDIRIVTDYKLMKKHYKEPIVITKPITNFDLSDLNKPNNKKSNNKKKLLFIGSVNKRKGLQYALLAINDLIKEKYDIEFHIVGEIADYHYKSYLDKLIEDHRLNEKVIFYNYIGDKAKLKEICRKCDLFVLPSLEEGFPRVIYEVMTQGLPIVTTNVGGIPYLLEHGINALIVNPCSSTQIASALKFLFSSHELMEKMTNNNYLLIEKILNKKPACQLFELLNEQDKS